MFNVITFFIGIYHGNIGMSRQDRIKFIGGVSTIDTLMQYQDVCFSIIKIPFVMFGSVIITSIIFGLGSLVRPRQSH